LDFESNLLKTCTHFISRFRRRSTPGWHWSRLRRICSGVEIFKLAASASSEKGGHVLKVCKQPDHTKCVSSLSCNLYAKRILYLWFYTHAGWLGYACNKIILSSAKCIERP